MKVQPSSLSTNLLQEVWDLKSLMKTELSTMSKERQKTDKSLSAVKEGEFVTLGRTIPLKPIVEA